VSNLITNACKFMTRGGRIYLTVREEENERVISVRDEGIGIGAAQLPPCLRPVHAGGHFARAHDQRLGIGLTLVKSLVELHGGTVQARSDGPGHGSEFVLRLPGLREAAQAQTGDGHPVAAKGQGHRVLVVDDNRDSAESLAMMLQLSGYEVHKAHDGLEPSRSRQAPPRRDPARHRLPSLNGYDVCRRMREQDESSEAFILALTGWGQEEDKAPLHGGWFDGHLVKPVNLAGSST
jgi:CheY-like chemotaxis protein